jgi:hypothetical protein
MFVRDHQGNIHNMSEFRKVTVEAVHHHYIVRAQMRTSASAIDLTRPLEQDAARKVMDQIIQANGKNVDLLPPEGADGLAAVELDDRYI